VRLHRLIAARGIDEKSAKKLEGRRAWIEIRCADSNSTLCRGSCGSERVQGAVGAVYWNTAPAFFGINFVPAEFPIAT
jgi:hypothetical protein